MTDRRRTHAAASALFGGVLVMAVVAVTATVAAGPDRTQILHGLTISNTVIALSLAVAGWPIVHHRPDNAIGWLLLAGGASYAVSGAGYPLIAAATAPGEHAVGWRLVATATDAGWPWAITLFVPLTLLVFPDGHLPSRRWRWTLAVVGAFTVCLEAAALFPVETYTSDLGVHGYLRWPTYDHLRGVNATATAAGLVIYLAALVSLVIRYRRGEERTRRQILWLLWASSIMVAAFIIDNIADTGELLSIFPITLVPLAIAIAVLRYRLLDIRLVISRSVLYALLTAGVVGVYIGLIAILNATLRAQVGLTTSLVATLVIAGIFHPVRVWLQRRVDDLLYGARSDPVRAMTAMGARFGVSGSDTPAGLAGVLEGLCTVMRIPWASVAVDGAEIAAHGAAPAIRQAIELRQAGDLVGELTVGLRSGESRLAPADERLLTLLCTSLAVAVRATSLAGQLDRSRAALVSAREAERTRLRRDLHDGLGPALTAMTLKADAARRLVHIQPDQSEALMAELRSLATATTASVRRLVNELRPSALDGLGLVGALREQADALSRHSDGSELHISIEASETLADLPAAVELAAYRIATEALTNVTRHSTASVATVLLTSNGTALTLTIRDNGIGGDAPWRPGIGLTSMHERAFELGGACDIAPDCDGGRVHVTIPLRGFQ